MKKALLLVEPKDEQMKALKANFPTVEFTTDPDDYSDVEIILGWKVPLAKQLLESKNLKWVQSRSAGVDYFLSKNLLKEELS